MCDAIFLCLFDTIIYNAPSQMIVQVYLEIPNGQKLAEALHSKVCRQFNCHTTTTTDIVNLGEREMVCWDLKVGTSTIRTFNPFQLRFY